MAVRLRGGPRERERSHFSTRQRVVILTFDTPGEAAEFDRLDPADRAGIVARLLAFPQTPFPFTCPDCGMTSYHPEDGLQGYCGNCHDWTAKL